jgi:regulator of PEP synthase PpsR (kinase-PPPase family)
MKKIHLHLVSDATGDTVRSVARACLVQFENVEANEHFWVLVRNQGQMQRVIDGIRNNPGVVLCTVVDEALRQILEQACRGLHIPFVALLDPVMGALAGFLGVRSSGLPGRQHAMDSNYFSRIDAVEYSIAHDDGQSVSSLNAADVILVGVSRTSKTPTCAHLAHRGLRAANVPYVPDVPLPRELLALEGVLIVGLTVDPSRLVQVRRNRLLMLKEEKETDYIDVQRVRGEVAEARRFYSKQGWPIIDASRRSIEETAAAVLQIYERRREESA